MSLMASILRGKFLHGRAHVFLQIRVLSSSISHLETTPHQQRIEKILVANRGEIACRIMRTAKRLGFGPSRFSLVRPRLAQLLKRLFHCRGGDSHRCTDKRFTFIGPPASAIRDMGDKSTVTNTLRHYLEAFVLVSVSKRIIGVAGMPLVPGYHGSEQDIEIMRLEADKIGYPILIKPTHGDGGKGLRIVRSQNDFVDSFWGAQCGAAASIGLNTILLEKYITQPRHIEVQ